MSVHVVYLVEEVALGQVFLPVLRLSPVSNIPPLLHTHLHLNRLFVRRTSGRSVKTAMRIGLCDMGAAPDITVLRACFLCHCILRLFIPHTGVRGFVSSLVPSNNFRVVLELSTTNPLPVSSCELTPPHTLLHAHTTSCRKQKSCTTHQQF